MLLETIKKIRSKQEISLIERTKLLCILLSAELGISLIDTIVTFVCLITGKIDFNDRTFLMRFPSVYETAEIIVVIGLFGMLIWVLKARAEKNDEMWREHLMCAASRFFAIGILITMLYVSVSVIVAVAFNINIKPIHSLIFVDIYLTLVESVLLATLLSMLKFEGAYGNN